MATGGYMDNYERFGVQENVGPSAGVDAEGAVLMGGVITALVRRNDLPRSDNEVGDTIRGGEQRATQGRRSLWKSREHIDRLRQEKRCFRCERQGCNTRICPLLPSRNPKTGNISANHFSLEAIDSKMYEEIDDGKEN